MTVFPRGRGWGRRLFLAISGLGRNLGLGLNCLLGRGLFMAVFRAHSARVEVELYYGIGFVHLLVAFFLAAGEYNNVLQYLGG